MNLHEKLSAPFSANQIEWRVGRTVKGGEAGFMFPYVTSRGIMTRLDEVFGIEGWSTNYTPIEGVTGGFLCTLSCCVDEATKTWVQKSDGAGRTDVEPIKGGISGALKRAAVLWGIGRYLYDLPQVFVNLEDKKFNGKIILPDWALPENERTGNTEVKIVYNNQIIEMTYEEACKVTVTKDKFNAGKMMKDIPEKSLSYLASRAATPEERTAAKIILEAMRG